MIDSLLLEEDVADHPPLSLRLFYCTGCWRCCFESALALVSLSLLLLYCWPLPRALPSTTKSTTLASIRDWSWKFQFNGHSIKQSCPYPPVRPAFILTLTRYGCNYTFTHAKRSDSEAPPPLLALIIPCYRLWHAQIPGLVVCVSVYIVSLSSGTSIVDEL